MGNLSTFVLGVAFLIGGMNEDLLMLQEGQGSALTICGFVVIGLGALRIYMARLVKDDREDRRP